MTKPTTTNCKLTIPNTFIVCGESLSNEPGTHQYCSDECYQWGEACLRWHNKILYGEFSHWCNEWDGLPIDETCEEFKFCICYGGKG